WPALRHRQQAGVPADRGAVRRRPRGPGTGVPALAQGLRGLAVKSVDEHLASILAALTPIAPLDLALLEAAGAVLAEPVTAPVPLPPFDNSAMDGYAVVAADLADVPVVLPVVGDIMAGDLGASGIRPGLAARIMTGAP